MTDDDQLRRLLSDAVSDIEPQDRLAEIRASVRPDPQVVPMSRPRSWLYVVSGAVASAAVIGVIAYTTSALSGPDGDGGVGVGAGQASDENIALAREHLDGNRLRRPVRVLLRTVHPSGRTGAKASTPCTTSAPTVPASRSSSGSGTAGRTSPRPTLRGTAATS